MIKKKKIFLFSSICLGVMIVAIALIIIIALFTSTGYQCLRDYSVSSQYGRIVTLTIKNTSWNNSIEVSVKDFILVDDRNNIVCPNKIYFECSDVIKYDGNYTQSGNIKNETISLPKGSTTKFYLYLNFDYDDLSVYYYLNNVFSK